MEEQASQPRMKRQWTHPLRTQNLPSQASSTSPIIVLDEAQHSGPRVSPGSVDVVHLMVTLENLSPWRILYLRQKYLESMSACAVWLSWLTPTERELYERRRVVFKAPSGDGVLCTPHKANEQQGPPCE